VFFIDNIIPLHFGGDRSGSALLGRMASAVGFTSPRWPKKWVSYKSVLRPPKTVLIHILQAVYVPADDLTDSRHQHGPSPTLTLPWY